MKNLITTCDICPIQMEGELNNGKAVYIRYRFGNLSVGIGDSISNAVKNSKVILTNGIGWDTQAMTEEKILKHVERYLNEYVDYK